MTEQKKENKNDVETEGTTTFTISGKQYKVDNKTLLIVGGLILAVVFWQIILGVILGYVIYIALQSRTKKKENILPK